MSVCTFYTYNKLLDIPIFKKRSLIYFPFSLFIAFISYYLNLYVSPFNLIIVAFLSILLNLFIHKKSINTTISFTIISISISYFSFTLISCISLPIFYLVFQFFGDEVYFDALSFSIICILQFVLLVLLFRIKRLKKGMPFLKEKTTSDFGVFIAVVLLIIASLFYIKYDTNIIFTILIFLIILCGLILMFWWRNRIKNTYLKKVQARNIESLEQALKEQKKEIDLLHHYNDELSKIIHKDNKLIPSMELLIKNLIISIRESIEEEQKSQIDEVLKKLEKICKDRSNLITNYESQNIDLRPTGIIAIDAILTYMKCKAEKSNVNFSFDCCNNFPEIIKNTIDENEFNTMLADLIENALIAISYQESQSKNIRVCFEYSDGCFCLNVFDSGIPFQPKTLLEMGQKRSTTHANAGGSGIGLITLFETIKKYNASFFIEEYTENESFTKKVSVCFDGLYEYRIKTTRAEAIAVCAERNDLIVL